MTKVISRLFADAAKAQAVKADLLSKGFPTKAVLTFGAEDKPGADDLKNLGMEKKTATAYAKNIGKGSTAMVVLATYKPLGAARIAREAFAATETIDVGDLSEETYVKEEPKGATESVSVLKDHPLFLTRRRDIEEHRPGLVSQSLGLRMLLPHKTGKRSVIRGGRYMSRSFWPMPLLTKNRHSDSVISGGKYISKYFWPMPLVTTSERRNSVIPNGGTPFSRMLNLPLLIK
ncbi:hypothetical protein [Marivita sp.]|jgi:hypothetical protein|uniref:hypothetical protein n=1 Tax=Marivita sp. TaxID=2003365 RepID=UPI003F706241